MCHIDPQLQDEEEQNMAETTTITLLKDGPLLLSGQVKITAADGQEVPVEGTQIALCRCGGSANKPFCDGAHKKINFKSDSAE
jgi:CDGSH-type Zn-finger protein